MRVCCESLRLEIVVQVEGDPNEVSAEAALPNDCSTNPQPLPPDDHPIIGLGRSWPTWPKAYDTVAGMVELVREGSRAEHVHINSAIIRWHK